MVQPRVRVDLIHGKRLGSDFLLAPNSKMLVNYAIVVLIIVNTLTTQLGEVCVCVCVCVRACVRVCVCMSNTSYQLASSL